MKILLDECITKRLKSYLKEHEVFTVSQQRWTGLKNGQLMAKAANENFDILLTIDKKIQSQQNTNKYKLIVVILDAPSSKLEEIVKFIPKFNELLNTFSKGNNYIITI